MVAVGVICGDWEVLPARPFDRLRVSGNCVTADSGRMEVVGIWGGRCLWVGGSHPHPFDKLRTGAISPIKGEEGKKRGRFETCPYDRQ